MTSFAIAIATATPRVSVALGAPAPGGVIGALDLEQGRRHGETLAPAIEAITRLTDTRLADVDLIALDAGPGLFTGLRVGVATAKALGSALDIPVVPCSSLEILAHPHRRVGRPVAAVVDARRGEVFWALYGPGGVPATEAAVARPEAVVEALRSHSGVLVTGDGARRYLSEAGLDVAPPTFDHPSARVLLEMAANRPALPAEKVVPTYLRDADVRIGWEQV